MEKFMEMMLQSQGVILQILSGLLEDKEESDRIFEYATEFFNMKPEQQDEQSGD